MSFLAGALCFDIGNPIADNSKGQIPDFRMFQNASHVEHPFTSLLKEFFFFPSFPCYKRATKKQQIKNKPVLLQTSFIFNRYFMDVIC